MTSMLWSVAMLAFSKVMAISYCAPAETSLCRVLTGTPSLYSSVTLDSSMQARTRSGICMPE